MAASYVVYGRRGTGSVPVEATLLLLGEPYEVKEAGRDVTAEAIARVNPMEQLPALILPNGELMTESAAILIHLADSHPGSRLSPPIDDLQRPAFLRWMTFVSAQIYALVWARDDPRRLAADEGHKAVILERTAERRAYCWRTMDAQVSPGRYLLGEDLSVLDLYVTVVSRWGPPAALLSGGAADGSGRSTRGPGSAAGDILGRAFSLRWRLNASARHDVHWRATVRRVRYSRLLLRGKSN